MAQKTKGDNRISEILREGSIKEKRALFEFGPEHIEDQVLFKFNLWARYHFPQYFKNSDAPAHREMDAHNFKAYKGLHDTFTNLAYRGASKTTRTKLFIAFCITSDTQHKRRYLKVLSHDADNSKQFVTDLYNMLIAPRVKQMYPEIFEKTETKREETMRSFTTSTGIKVAADTVGTSQRGAVQEDARPDLIIFDDFETRETLRSAVKTQAIWDNMSEAKDSLANDGSCIYLGNYISELGNVQRLVEREDKNNPVQITPLVTDDNEITWPTKYSWDDIKRLRKTDDFEGEYLCKPSASRDIFFARDRIEAMPVRQPLKVSGEFKIFHKYNPAHRYAGGHDVGGGLGLDSSTSVFIDFSMYPAEVVATFRDNTILPEDFGEEIYREAGFFGDCLVAPENNKFDQTVLRAKQLGANVYKTRYGRQTKINTPPPTLWGWQTNSLTKSEMFMALKRAVDDGLLNLNDIDLIREAKSYSRNDLIDREEDPRLSTRHFDLLTACAICWQMKDMASSERQVVQRSRPETSTTNIAK